MDSLGSTHEGFWRNARSIRAYLLVVACVAVWIVFAIQDHSRQLANLTYLARKVWGLEP